MAVPPIAKAAYSSGVPDRVDDMSGVRSELGVLLELLHRGDAPFRTIYATYRIWRDEERASSAWRADVEERKRRGAAIATFGIAATTPEPAESEELLRIWRDGRRIRVQHEGGLRDGEYGVRRDELWWQWNSRSGAMSNQDDPKVGSGVGEELSVMLDPTPLLGILKFAAIGRSTVAGRATLTGEATPRSSDPRSRHPAFELHQLGNGADRYLLEIDTKRGVLLEAVALRDGEPFQRVTTVELVFDRVVPEERFVFEPPAGEDIQPTNGGLRPQRLPVPEAQQRAPFTVLIPDRIPAEWSVLCVFTEAASRPRHPAQVSLNYSSEDGHESFSLSQFSVSERPSGYEQLTAGDGWHDVERDGSWCGSLSRARQPLRHKRTFSATERLCFCTLRRSTATSSPRSPPASSPRPPRAASRNTAQSRRRRCRPTNRDGWPNMLI